MKKERKKITSYNYEFVMKKLVFLTQGNNNNIVQSKLKTNQNKLFKNLNSTNIFLHLFYCNTKNFLKNYKSLNYFKRFSLYVLVEMSVV